MLKNQRGTGMVLDAGCGEGHFLLPLACRFKTFSFTGLDYNPRLVDFVNKYASFFKLPVTATQADFNGIKLNGNYDLILCIAVLQMLKEDESFLLQLQKVLSPEGKLLLNVPLKHKTVWRKKNDQSEYNKIQKASDKKYTIEEFLRLLESAGLSAEAVIPTNGKAGTLGNELLNFVIDGLQMGGFLKKVLFALISPFALVFILLLNLLNSLLPKKNPSGVVVIAQRL